MGLSALWGTVVKVELVNIAFSVDSILVAVAMSNKTWVVLTRRAPRDHRDPRRDRSAADDRAAVPAIVDGAFIIIAWVGLKLLIEYLRAEGNDRTSSINKWFSFGLIAAIFLRPTSTRAARARRRTRTKTTPRRRCYAKDLLGFRQLQFAFSTWRRAVSI